MITISDIDPVQIQELSENDKKDVMESIKDLLVDTYENIDHSKYHDAAFDEYVYNEIYASFLEHVDENDFRFLYNGSVDRMCFELGVKVRTVKDSSIIEKINEKTYASPSFVSRMEEQVKYLSEIEQPEQRTPEWYKFRYNHITGSNAWKILSTESCQRQLYYEKLSPLIVSETKHTNNMSDSPFNWGHKYEPLTTQFYEYYNNVKVGEFGCIPHKEIPFLAASPDGIVVDGHTIGRMLEIKNVVSREITGVPKTDYYVQMQIQMEVCDLDECDFVETKFTEYESYHDFINDSEKIKKGMIIVILKDSNHFVYEYSPLLKTNEKSLDDFTQHIYSKYGLNENTLSSTEINENGEVKYKWFKNIYWKLDKYSHVLVPRNKKWFDEIFPHMNEFWNNVLEERLIEDSHLKYQPKRRVKKQEEVKTMSENIIEPMINNYMISSSYTKPQCQKSICMIDLNTL
jgi:putative phage-type endonuclease